MTKKEFLDQLKELIPNAEASEIISDFEEHFSNGMENGKTEEEIADSLGSPEEIAKEYGYQPKEVVIEEKHSGVSSRIFGIVGILLFDVLIGIALVATVFAIWISLWAVVVALFFTSIALIIGAFATLIISPLPWYITLSAGLALLGLTGLFGIAMVYVSKGFFIAIKWFVELHIKIIKGE